MPVTALTARLGA